VAESNKFEEIDKKQPSTSATPSPPSRTRDKSEEILWKWKLTHCPAVPEIIATKPEQVQGQV
jgi:hypothetical protein